MTEEYFDDNFCFRELIALCPRIKLADTTAVLLNVSGEGLHEIGDDEKSLLEHYYGNGTRFEKAKKFYSLTRVLLSYVLPGVDYFALYKSILNYEWLSHANIISPGYRYRDHIFHAARVTVLAFWLVDHCDFLSMEKFTRYLRRTYGSYARSTGLSDDNWEQIALQSILIACLLHDICRPLEFISDRQSELARQFDKIYSPHVLYSRTVADLIMELRSSTFRRRLKKRDIIAEIKAGTHCHAALSALQILAVAMEPGFDPYTRLVADIAAEAVYHHHGQPLPFKKSPFRYLLTLADHMQEWGRDVAKVASKKDFHTISFIPDAPKMAAVVNDNSVQFFFYLIEEGERGDIGFDLDKYRKGKTVSQETLNCEGNGFTIICSTDECIIG